MSDELEDLKAALRAATPAPDADAKARAIALARKNFEADQGSDQMARPNKDRTAQSGALKGLLNMLNILTPRPLMATTALATLAIAVGLGWQVSQGSKPWQIGGEPTIETLGPVEEEAEFDSTLALTLPQARSDKRLEQRARAAGQQSLGSRPVAPAAPSPMMDSSVGGELTLQRMAPQSMPLMEAMPVGEIAAIPQDREQYANEDPSALKSAADVPVSTFSIDVDTASYSLMRSWLNGGSLPSPDAIRVEELVNYFDYTYPAPDTLDTPFRTSVSVSETPWNAGTQLIQIGIKGYEAPMADRPPLDLVFLIDTSGSMQDRDKLPLLISSFKLLLSNLRDEDKVAIVTYAGSAGIALEPTAASDRAKILASLDRLTAGGSTAGAAGLQGAYALAEQMQGDGRIGRVVLATDGDFNVGISDPEALKDFIAGKRDSGTYLSVLGFGRGNTNDALMQALAQNGNGQAAYIDTLAEAERVLVRQAGGALIPIAGDVKIQVEFNPAQIAEYRLIGYETRALRREDFNNDKVDAGEIGSGHTITALYEVTPVGSASARLEPLRYQNSAAETPAASQSDELAFLRLRYKRPGEGESRLIETPITPDLAQISTTDTGFAAAVAGFGELLRGGAYQDGWTMQDAATLASGALGDDPYGDRAEFLRLARLAAALGQN